MVKFTSRTTTYCFLSASTYYHYVRDVGDIGKAHNIMIAMIYKWKA